MRHVRLVGVKTCRETRRGASGVKCIPRLSKYWTIVLPGALCGVVYYAYTTGGYFSQWIQRLVDPLLWLGRAIANTIFGV